MTPEEVRRQVQERNDRLKFQRASPEYKAKRLEQERRLLKARRKYGLERPAK